MSSDQGSDGPNTGGANRGVSFRSQRQKPAPAGRGQSAFDSFDPLMGRVVLDRYEITRRIGSGGMGAVYLGKQIAVGREVALKILRADLLDNESVRERFRREAEIIGNLRHPNTIQLIDYGETQDGLAIMVMELLVGQPLSDRLKQLGPLPMKDAIRTGMEIAGSLAEAHGLGLVHRDLKPANIFLVEVGSEIHAKVLDFGIARILDEESTRLTSAGQVFGTPRYMSPEQGTSTGDVDHRADLYSLGLIIFECLVGQPPFVANTSIQYLSAHATQPPPKLSEHMPDAPKALEALVDACLVKEPENRIQTAEGVTEGLRRILIKLESAEDAAMSAADTKLEGIGRDHVADLLPPPAPVPAPPPVTKPGRDDVPARVPQDKKKLPPLMLAAGVAFVLAGFILGGIFLWRGKKDVVVTESVDAGGQVQVAALTTKDAGEPNVAVPVKSVDAGFADAAAPARGKPKPDAGYVKRRRPRTPHKKRPKKPSQSTDHTVPGQDVISGPRGIFIANAADDDPTLEAAKKCKASRISAGPAKLTLSGCKKNCAVLLDGVCAGRTPVTDVAVPTGNKSVTVVCKGKQVLDKIAKLRAEKTVTLRCR